MSTCPHCQQVLTTREYSTGKCPLCSGVWEPPVVQAEIVKPQVERPDSPPPVAITLARVSLAIPLLSWIFMCGSMWLFRGASGGGDIFPILTIGTVLALASCVCGIMAAIDGIRYANAKLIAFGALGLVLSGANLLVWLAGMYLFALTGR